MNNTLFLISTLLISTGLSAATEPVSGGCANGTGILLTGNQGGTYCQSKISMNWWSTHAWCQSIGGELIDITSECIKDNTPSTVDCPNLYQIGSGDIWTQNAVSQTHSFLVNLSQGKVYTVEYLNYYGSGNRTRKYPALCVNFK